MDQARDASRQAGGGHLARPLDVGAQHPAVRSPAMDARRQVEGRVRAGHQRGERGRVEHIPAHALHREPLQGADVVPHQAPHRVPVVEESADEVRPEMARGSGDRGQHGAIIPVEQPTRWRGREPWRRLRR